ncbi:RsmB/NOP family class I SAM-dependent RNA methyltransferase [Roseicitreum antarcticum]|uniref:RsmB/NOP family class I SAM-dependent RNA methyltransferase n=1 Tax=Roseicitreum antarcticum TaxID=564137 RepID=UPI0037CCC23D
MPPSPRGGAVALLDAVLSPDTGASLPEVLTAPPAAFAALDPAGCARAQRLALTTLRHLDRADAILSPHLRKAPPPHVKNLLRLAVVEMLHEGAAAYGVVNSAVGALRGDRRLQAMAGMVNAVLRRASETPDGTWAALPPQRLPQWLRQPMVHHYGRAVVGAIEAAHMEGAATDLTLRPGVAGPDGVTLPTGSLRVAGAQISALPGYDAGDWWVQDAASALPARMLGDVAGLRVLDLCAAPGGKTMQLAAAGAQVTALDLSGPRLARLRDNLARTGLEAEIVTADALHWLPDAPFDAVLLDAPCSASGTIRRHPDLPFAKAAGDLAALTALQARLLDRVLTPSAGLLRPGGVAVYCTCSLLAAEGEDQARAALDRHPHVVAQPVTLPGLPEDWRTADGGIRTRPDYWPELGGIDGFYMVALRIGAETAAAAG